MNSTAIKSKFKQIEEIYKACFHRKAFVSIYTMEGMDEEEILEAGFNLDDLCQEYDCFE